MQDMSHIQQLAVAGAHLLVNEEKRRPAESHDLS